MPKKLKNTMKKAKIKNPPESYIDEVDIKKEITDDQLHEYCYSLPIPTQHVKIEMDDDFGRRVKSEPNSAECDFLDPLQIGEEYCNMFANEKTTKKQTRTKKSKKKYEDSDKSWSDSDDLPIVQRKPMKKSKTSNSDTKVSKSKTPARSDRIRNETPEQRERRLLRKKMYKQRVLANETPEQRAERLSKNKLYYRMSLLKMPKEKKEELKLIKQARREQDRLKFANETAEEKEQRLKSRNEKYRGYVKHKLDNETLQEKLKRLERRRLSKRKRLQNMTDEQKEIYRMKRSKEWEVEKLRNRPDRRRHGETLEQREKRLARQKAYRKHVLATETEEEREMRLKRKKQANYRRLIGLDIGDRIETAEERESRLERARSARRRKIENETPEQREVRLSKRRASRKKKTENESPKEKEARLQREREQRSQTKVDYERHLKHLMFGDEDEDEYSSSSASS